MLRLFGSGGCCVGGIFVGAAMSNSEDTKGYDEGNDWGSSEYRWCSCRDVGNYSHNPTCSNSFQRKRSLEVFKDGDMILYEELMNLGKSDAQKAIKYLKKMSAAKTNEVHAEGADVSYEPSVVFSGEVPVLAQVPQDRDQCCRRRL